jgi:hypothetical protein
LVPENGLPRSYKPGILAIVAAAQGAPMRRFTVLLIALTLLGCGTNAARTGNLRVGMARADVISALGKPVSMGADRQSEILYYRLMEGGLRGETRAYFVRLVDGKVDSFGRINEFQVPEASLPSPPPPPPPQ